MKPKTVFFDFGGTLAEPIADPFEVWTSISERVGLQTTRADLEAAVETANAWMYPAIYDYMGRLEEFWLLYDGRVLDCLGIDDADGRLSAEIQQGFHRVVWNRVYPESEIVLRKLRDRDCSLGVISNAAEDLNDRLRDLGLIHYFETVTFSQEARANKPDPTVFRLALRRARCAPGAAVHVGNTYEEDVVGARGVGMRPILVDRLGERPDADCDRVADLLGVLTLLD